MTNLPPPVPPIPRETALLVKPSFIGALRGIWLFTWRSQLSWRRVPMGLVLLLILPALVYLTTSPPRGWSPRHSWAANPSGQLDGFSRRLGRYHLQLQPGQQAELLRIFEEEFEQANRELSAAQASELSVSQQSEQLKACYDRIFTRAQPILDEKQVAQFRTFQKRRLDENLGKIGEPRWSRTEPFYHWLASVYFFVVLPLNCVRSCGGLILDELQADTLGFLATRPLSRARLLIVKYLSQTAWLQMTMLIEALLLFAVGQLREMPALGALLPLFLAAQFLAVLVWSALGTLLGQLTKRYLALALVYGFIVEMGIGRIPTNINTLSMMRHLKTLLAHNPALQGLYEWTGTGLPLSISALVLGSVLFLGLAALLFTVREYHHTGEMQK